MDIFARANELGQYRAELMKVYSQADEELLDFSKRRIPLSGFLLVTMLRRLWQIEAATADLCCHQNYYSMKILYRSLIEHYFKSQYAWMRLAEEKTDDVGKDYYVYATVTEAEEVAKWDRRAEEMGGSGRAVKGPQKRSQDRFRLRNVVAYIHDKVPAKDHNALPLLVLPVYSRLSSFVHCGVGADVDDLHASITEPAAYIETLETSFLMLASSFLFTFAAFAALYRHFEKKDNPRLGEYCQTLSNVLHAAQTEATKGVDGDTI